ncbi:MAG: hypothetical protein IPP42_24155 [Saprospiraceae bacterium]|nr:hypothetical protein [Saprospiraceae bacterium]
MNRNLILILLLSVGKIVFGAQNIIARWRPTISTYFGDLAPYNLKQSFSQLKPGWDLYFSKRVFDPIYVELDFEIVSVSADDKDQTSEGRKKGTCLSDLPLTSLSGLVGLRIGLLKKEELVLQGSRYHWILF